jgi:glycosyltransferase involved in cell wall biosynthesis
MKRALIATLFNEAYNLSRWWDCLMRQMVLPDQLSIVDGGSTDGTWEKLQELAKNAPVRVLLKQQRCNIATGRNLAISLTDAEIIAANDAGSFPKQDWFAEITQPLLADPGLDVVGGESRTVFENAFQKSVEPIEKLAKDPTSSDQAYPSSRNVAFRRQAWLDVGGYPEWLTLTAEDALFNQELHRAGKKFIYNPKAVVLWPMRENAKAYFRMYYNYGYGAAEARLYSRNYRRRLATVIFPPLLLLSHHRFRYFGFRWRRNAASAQGWLDGCFKGHHAPETWKRVDGVLLSPEAQACRRHLQNLQNALNPPKHTRTPSS